MPFTAVYISYEMISPAAVNRATGELFLNGKLWDTIQPEHRIYILLHEAAHYILQTDCEYTADQWAQEHYLKLGYSLRESVLILSRYLCNNNPQHRARTLYNYVRALKADKNA
jgi:hypothetical protein